MESGIYTMVLWVKESSELFGESKPAERSGLGRSELKAGQGAENGLTITIGSLGELLFPQGYYAYTGSARGPGGLSRVVRHQAVLEGRNSTRRWHIDYLLPHTTLEMVAVTRTSLDLECSVARDIGSKLEAVPKFGSTDCDCLGHLHRSRERGPMVEVVLWAHSLAQAEAER
jgi:endonuclease-3